MSGVKEYAKPEAAIVYRGGGRRYLTRKAALRAEAKEIMRQAIRDGGEERVEETLFQREVARMAAQMERGEEPTFDWDEATDAERAFMERLSS